MATQAPSDPSGQPAPRRRGVRPRGFSVFAVALMLASPLVAWADKASDVAALEAKCAQDREAKIKPLREAQIAKCKADPRNDPEHCEHFFSDYGNGGRGYLTTYRVASRPRRHAKHSTPTRPNAHRALREPPLAPARRGAPRYFSSS